MNRLRVQEVAKERDINLSQLHAEVNARRLKGGVKGVAMGTLRRYWHSTKDGSPEGKEIDLVDVNLIVTIARVLGVSVNDLFNEEVLGPYGVVTDAG